MIYLFHIHLSVMVFIIYIYKQKKKHIKVPLFYVSLKFSFVPTILSLHTNPRLFYKHILEVWHKSKAMKVLKLLIIIEIEYVIYKYSFDNSLRQD